MNFKKLLLTSFVTLGIAAIVVGITSHNVDTTSTIKEVPTTSTPQVSSSLVVSDKTVTKKITYLTLDESRVVYLQGQINPNLASDVVQQLKELDNKSNKPIYLLISSPGGSVLDGALIISQMEGSKSPVNTVCLKICASMAAIIHQFGNERLILDRAILMFHPASGGAQGQFKNMKSLLDTMDSYIERMNTTIVKRSKMTADEFKLRVAYELWLDGEIALSYGFVDKLIHITNNLKDEDTFFIRKGDGVLVNPLDFRM